MKLPALKAPLAVLALATLRWAAALHAQTSSVSDFPNNPPQTSNYSGSIAIDLHALAAGVTGLSVYANAPISSSGSSCSSSASILDNSGNTIAAITGSGTSAALGVISSFQLGNFAFNPATGTWSATVVAQVHTAGQTNPYTGTGAYTDSFPANGAAIQLGTGPKITVTVAGQTSVAASASFGSISYTTTSAPPPPVSLSPGGWTGTYRGSAQGPPWSVLPSGATYTVSGTAAATAAGSYSYSVTGIGNYSGTAAQAWTIASAPLVISANPAAMTYGGALPAFSAQMSGLQGGDTAAVVSGLSLSTAATSRSPAGTYPIIASGASAANYAISYVAGALTINPAPLTVTANNETATYGGSALSGGNGVSYSGFVNGDNASDLSGAVVYSGDSQGATNAGTYVLTPGGLSDPNYAITYDSGTLSIEPEPTTFTFSPQSFVFNGAAQGPAIAPDPPGATYATTGTASAVAAGSYTVAAAATGNYTGSSGPVSWTIAQATPSLTWPAPAAITYGTALSAVQLDATASVPGTFSYTPSAGTILGAGAGQALSVTFTPADAADYNPVSGTAPITVNRANQSVTVSPTSASIVAGQSVTFTAQGGSGAGGYVWGGAASGSGPTATATFDSAGAYIVSVYRAGDANTNPSAAAEAAVTVQAPAPPTAAIQVSPAGGTAPLAATVSWTTANASSAVVAGNGVASSSLNGSQNILLSSPGSYTYAITAGGPGGEVTESAVATAAAPQYTLSTAAIGNGSVTPGGTYPPNTVVTVAATPGAEAYFSGWTGAAGGAANPMTVTMTGNLSLYANFASMQTQTIAFSAPATLSYPSSAATLSATATSGLPVSFSVVSGPATVTGNQLTLTGAGPVVIEASQSGNGQWLPAAPVTASVQSVPPPVIARIRFNALGNEARVTAAGSGQGGAFLWTDAAGVQTSPWPAFADPLPAVPSQQNVALPTAPAAEN